jgi:DNA replication protein DnaC
MNYGEACIPAKAARLSWNDLVGSKHVEVVHGWADQYPTWLAAHAVEVTDVGQGLLLHGGAGSGKTTAAALALKEVLDYKHSGWFVPAMTLENMLHRQMDLGTYMRKVETIDGETQDIFEQITSRLTKVRYRWHVLVLDDWGRERMSSAFLQEYIEGLLRERFNRGLPSIVTTNLSEDQIEQSLSPQFVSFLQEAFTYVDFGSRDFRGEG